MQIYKIKTRQADLEIEWVFSLVDNQHPKHFE